MAIFWGYSGIPYFQVTSASILAEAFPWSSLRMRCGIHSLEEGAGAGGFVGFCWHRNHQT
jgi:hypothetical protein